MEEEEEDDERHSLVSHWTLTTEKSYTEYEKLRTHSCMVVVDSALSDAMAVTGTAVFVSTSDVTRRK